MTQKMTTNLFDFAWCGNSYTTSWDQHIQNLATLVRSEAWGPQNQVLKNYVSYTFENLAIAVNQGRVTAETYFPTTSYGMCCCFNTGLFTQYDEPIYAYFKRNELEAVQAWYLKGFKTANASELLSFEALPQRMNYLTDPADFILDTQLPWRMNLQHILGDEKNIGQLPRILQQTTDREIVLQLFNGALQSTKKRLTANYNLAVPNSFHGQIQLLVPIWFGQKAAPDLVLALSRENGCYVGRTCLTPAMAYRSARLIATPTVPWMLAIKESKSFVMAQSVATRASESASTTSTRTFS